MFLNYSNSGDPNWFSELKEIRMQIQIRIMHATLIVESELQKSQDEAI